MGLRYLHTFEQYNQIENNINVNFWKWFGKSKTIENGKPIVLFHGTNQDFKSFDIKRIGYSKGNYGHYGYGFYFSDDIREAETYGKRILKCYIRMKNPFTATDEELLLLKNNGVRGIPELVIKSIGYDSLYKEVEKIDKNAAILMNYIKEFNLETAWEKFTEEERDIKDWYNDLTNYTEEFTSLNKYPDVVPDYVLEFLNDIGINMDNLIYNKGFEHHTAFHWITDLGNYSQEITDIVKKLGYDGIIYGSEYVAFEANDIKSIDNDGTWDSEDDNIFS
jgi:hypothetical protein